MYCTVQCTCTHVHVCVLYYSAIFSHTLSVFVKKPLEKVRSTLAWQCTFNLLYMYEVTAWPFPIVRCSYSYPGGKVRMNTLNCAVFRRCSASFRVNLTSFLARFCLFSPEYRLNACNLANRRTRNGEKAKTQY